MHKKKFNMDKNTVPLHEGNPLQYSIIQNSFHFVHLGNAIQSGRMRFTLSLHFLQMEISFWFEIRESPNEIL